MLSSTVFLGCGREAEESPPTTTLSYLGLSAFSALSPNFPCDEYLKELNKSPRPIMSVLWGTFGDDLTCIAKFIEENHDRDHAVEIHFSNERCRAWGRCFEGEVFPDLDTDEYNELLSDGGSLAYNVLIGRAFEITLTANTLGNFNTKWFLSTGLEDSYSPKAYEYLYNVLKSIWPYGFIRTPLKDGFHHEFVERHSLSAECTEETFASNDGVGIAPGEVEFYRENHSDCKGTILWTCGLQGICGEFVSPRDRTFELSSDDVLMWDVFLGR